MEKTTDEPELCKKVVARVEKLLNHCTVGIATKIVARCITKRYPLGSQTRTLILRDAIEAKECCMKYIVKHVVNRIPELTIMLLFMVEVMAS